MNNQQQILILGLGREGLSSYNYLRDQFADQHLLVADEKPIDQLNPDWQKIVKTDNNVTFFQLPSANLQKQLTPDQSLLIIKTAGIPLIKLAELNLPTHAEITSNTQLFFDEVMQIKAMKVIGVTGTKGKSTTAALIHHVLATSDLNAYLGGNIGKPPLEVLKEIKDFNQPSMVILELSSHQLAEIKTSPQIAVIQAIAEEHLDYYGSITAYAEAKANITLNQTSQDLLIYNQDNQLVQEIADRSAAQKISFSLTQAAAIIEPIIAIDQIPLAGQFNLYNVMPAIIIGQHFHLSNQQIAHAIRSFKSLPHRLEFINEINGVKYYNDSLATNPHATIRALEAFADQPVILIAGGFDRGLDYTPLTKKINFSSVKKLILFPTTGRRIAKGIEKFPVKFATTMTEAVQLAASQAVKGDVVLMSPASASFNLFKDYADRGNQFKTAVNNLTEK